MFFMGLIIKFYVGGMVYQKMQRPRYIISTNLCTVSHVVNPSSVQSLNKDVKIYMDDILYKDSAYDKGLSITIKEFCSVKNKICIAFRNTPKVLTSKKGRYRLERKRYEEILQILLPDYYANFDDGRIFVEGDELLEPIDMKDFVERINTKHKLFGTEFINNIIESGLMLRLDGCMLYVREIYDCTCCGASSKGYLKYLWDIGEMNALTHLKKHNYNVLSDIMKTTSEDSVLSLVEP